MPSGTRLSDRLFEIALSQALGPSGRGVITAVAAADNVRSIKLCERNGLTGQTRYDTHHVLLTGAFGTDAAWHQRVRGGPHERD
jgi:RimJ/RimL family protein N-acetyltransferase